MSVSCARLLASLVTTVSENRVACIHVAVATGAIVFVVSSDRLFTA